jgi:hypothetical protein
VTGLLVPPDQPDRLVEAMLRLGSDPALRRQMGANGLRRFEEAFSLYSLARQTENFYRQVLEDWHGPARQAPQGLTPEIAVPFRRDAIGSAACARELIREAHDALRRGTPPESIMSLVSSSWIPSATTPGRGIGAGVVLRS